MSGRRAKAVTLNILDKEYVVACPDDERAELLESAEYLSGRMQEIRENGKVVGTERIAVIAALNIVHELLRHKDQEENYHLVDDEVSRLSDKIDAALKHSRLSTD